MYIYLFDYVCYLRTQTTQRSYIYYNYLFQYMLILFFKNMQSLPVSTFLRLPQTPFFIQVVSIWGFPGGSVKNLPAMQETQETRVQSLEEGMATHSSILARTIPWTEEPAGPWTVGLQRAGHD